MMGLVYMELIISIVILIAIECAFGFATKSIIENKGYRENWFWWGFFFGLLAVLVALSKPQNPVNNSYLTGSSFLDDSPLFRDESRQRSVAKASSTDWRCTCGRVNPNYFGTCVCGRSRYELEEKKETRETEAEKKKEEQEKLQASIDRKTNENLALDNLKKMKELLDIGAITEEEYAEKKRQLLDI